MVVSLEDEVLQILIKWSDEDMSDKIEAIPVVGTSEDVICLPKVEEVGDVKGRGAKCNAQAETEKMSLDATDTEGHKNVVGDEQELPSRVPIEELLSFVVSQGRIKDPGVGWTPRPRCLGASHRKAYIVKPTTHYSGYVDKAIGENPTKYREMKKRLREIRKKNM